MIEANHISFVVLKLRLWNTTSGQELNNFKLLTNEDKNKQIVSIINLKSMEVNGIEDLGNDCWKLLDDFSDYHLDKHNMFGRSFVKREGGSNLNVLTNIFLECIFSISNPNMRMKFFSILNQMSSMKFKFYDNLSNLHLLVRPQEQNYFEILMKTCTSLILIDKKFEIISINDSKIKFINQEIIDLLNVIIKIIQESVLTYTTNCIESERSSDFPLQRQKTNWHHTQSN